MLPPSRKRVTDTDNGAPQVRVRLFAFCNRRGGLPVVFSPEHPVVILKAENKDAGAHPCRQWAPLSDLLFQKRPHSTQAVYVMESTSADPLIRKEEDVAHISAGPLVKRMSNILSRLNPKSADIVAAGASCVLAVKLALLGQKQWGHEHRLIGRILLVCPPSLDAVEVVIREAVRRPRSDFPPPACVVLLSPSVGAAVAERWRALIHSDEGRMVLETGASIVSTDVSPSLFDAVSRLVSAECEGNSDEESQDACDGALLDHQRLFRVVFERNPMTKQIEQVNLPTSLDEPADTYDRQYGSSTLGVQQVRGTLTTPAAAPVGSESGNDDGVDDEASAKGGLTR